jgi:hypothetical protein
VSPHAIKRILIRRLAFVEVEAVRRKAAGLPCSWATEEAEALRAVLAPLGLQEHDLERHVSTVATRVVPAMQRREENREAHQAALRVGRERAEAHRDELLERAELLVLHVHRAARVA